MQKSAEEPKRVITDSEKEFLIQRLPELGVRKAHADLCAEEDDDEVDQKTQWCLEMLPGMQEQHQMIAQVFRWAVDAERKRRNCVIDVKENASIEPEVREHMRYEECWMSSVQGEKTSREMTDVCENEDAAKVTPKMGSGGSHPQATLSPERGEGKAKGDRGKGGVGSKGTLSMMQCEESSVYETEKGSVKGDQEGDQEGVKEGENREEN